MRFLAGSLLLACGLSAPFAFGQLASSDGVGGAGEVTFEQKLNSQLPLDLVFRDDTGRKVKLQEYFGDKPVVLSLVYYECPMLCTLVLNGVVESLKEVPFDIGDEYRVLTVSFDHEETHVLAAAKKQGYVKEYNREGAEKDWHFLVGEKEPVAQLADAVGFQFKYDPDTDEYAHRSGIMIITPQGRVSRYFPGVDYNPLGIRLGLVEASRNKIGSFVDRLFLLCYHYDPAVGQYGLLINRVINIACTATVLVLGATIFLFMKHERRMKRLSVTKA